MADNKHTKGDLQQMQAVPLAGKILMTKRRIRCTNIRQKQGEKRSLQLWLVKVSKGQTDG